MRSKTKKGAENHVADHLSRLRSEDIQTETIRETFPDEQLYVLHSSTRPWYADLVNYLVFFFGKLTYVLKEEDTNIIRGIPQIYNDNRNIKQQMATG